MSLLVVDRQSVFLTPTPLFLCTNGHDAGTIRRASQQEFQGEIPFGRICPALAVLSLTRFLGLVTLVGNRENHLLFARALFRQRG